MLDALKQLFENNVISDEIKESIEAAWETRVTENRQQASQQLREEFAQKYEHDKNAMIAAVDQMLSEQLSSEIAEFAEDRKQLAEMKVQYAKKMKKDSTLVKEFMTRQLAAEIKELHEDQKASASKFAILENFIVEALAQEITEFYQDKQDLAETKVRLIREGKEELKQVKQQFVERAAKMVESVVSENLNTEISSLREDIEAARRSDFGRKLFEAFVSEYQTSYLNEKSETAKLLKVIDLKDLAIKEAAHAVIKAEQIIESKEAEVRSLKETHDRSAIMSELIAPLNTEQKGIMTDLMMGVKTSKLRESFDRYLPAVIAGGPSRKKQALVEAKEITGNKISNSNRGSEEDSNIIDIRRLAGL